MSSNFFSVLQFSTGILKISSCHWQPGSCDNVALRSLPSGAFTPIMSWPMSIWLGDLNLTWRRRDCPIFTPEKPFWLNLEHISRSSQKPSQTWLKWKRTTWPPTLWSWILKEVKQNHAVCFIIYSQLIKESIALDWKTHFAHAWRQKTRVQHEIILKVTPPETTANIFFSRFYSWPFRMGSKPAVRELSYRNTSCHGDGSHLI